MTKGLAAWMLGYGMILFIAGAAAFLAYPAQGPLPLLAGAIAGGLASSIGVLLFKGVFWAPKAAFMLTLAFFAVAVALAMQHWLVVFRGEPDFAAPVIDTALLAISGILLWAMKTRE